MPETRIRLPKNFNFWVAPETTAEEKETPHETLLTLANRNNSSQVDPMDAIKQRILEHNAGFALGMDDRSPSSPITEQGFSRDNSREYSFDNATPLMCEPDLINM